MSETPVTPVSGYRAQSQENLDTVNNFKALEERILRTLDTMRNASENHNSIYNQRWLAIGRTQLEQAFMAINRAVFQPSRVTLPEDNA